MAHKRGLQLTNIPWFIDEDHCLQVGSEALQISVPGMSASEPVSLTFGAASRLSHVVSVNVRVCCTNSEPLRATDVISVNVINRIASLIALPTHSPG